MTPEPPFYVAYLKLPHGLRRPLAAIAGALLLADLVLALALVRGQPARGDGAWGGEGEVYEHGRFRARPYPLLRMATPAGERTVLLVDAGKHGAPEGLEALDGKVVDAAGYAIRRGDVTVLQLDGLPAEGKADLPPLPPASPSSRIALTGEIVDAKCWAGAMNPGDGKAHKGCGALCLLGGIPALFVTEEGDGTAHWYLMAGRDGGALDPAARASIGERQTLVGTVARADGLSIFTPDATPGGGG